MTTSNTSKRYKFFKGDISDKSTVDWVFREVQPEIIIHLAAETHVDQSITYPYDIIRNIIKSELGPNRPISEVFSYIDPIPIASASIAAASCTSRKYDPIEYMFNRGSIL